MERLHHGEGREVVRSYRAYGEAQAAVDRLSDRDFPVQHLSIVAEDLQYVENITGRRGYGTEASRGLVSGALVGALVGFFLGLFSVVDPLVSALALAFYGVLFGGLVGAVFGLVTHWASRGRRDFSSTGSIQAARYNLLAAPHVAADASRLLDDAAEEEVRAAGND